MTPNFKRQLLLGAATVTIPICLWLSLMLAPQLEQYLWLADSKLYWYVIAAGTFYLGKHWRGFMAQQVYDRVRQKNERTNDGGDTLPIAVCYRWGDKDWRGRRQCLQLVLMVKRDVGWDHKEFKLGLGVDEYMSEDKDSTPDDDIDMPEFMRRIGFDVQCVRVSRTKRFEAYEIPGDAVGWARFYLKINSYRVQTAEQLHAYLAEHETVFHFAPSARTMDERLYGDAVDRGLTPKTTPTNKGPDEPPPQDENVTDIGGYRSRRI